MASIHREIIIAARPEDVWAAVRDVGAVHQRLTPGLVVDTVYDGEARVVTFANGLVVREVIVDSDDTARRLAYTSVGAPLTHHNSSAQVFAEGENATRYVWITDLLPNALAPTVAGLMDQGLAVIKRTLEAQASQG